MLSKLPQMVGNIGNNVAICDIQNDLIIGNDSIRLHADDVSSRIFYWDKQLAEARQVLKILKVDYDKWLSDKKADVCLTQTFKSEIAKDDAVMQKFPIEYAKWNKDLIDYEYKVEILEATKNAFLSKKSIIIEVMSEFIQGVLPSGAKRQEWDKQFVDNGGTPHDAANDKIV